MSTTKTALVWDRPNAAVYLAERSTVTAEHLLADPALVAVAFGEATAMHPLHPSCEHCVRVERARDILLGIPPSRPGELRLL